MKQVSNKQRRGKEPDPSEYLHQLRSIDKTLENVSKNIKQKISELSNAKVTEATIKKDATISADAALINISDDDEWM